MNTDQPSPSPRLKRLGMRLLLIAVGLLAGLLLAEAGLKIIGQPRFFEPHSGPPQFMFAEHIDPGTIGWVNRPSTSIRFIYDGNPRGYFGAQNEVDHLTNAIGFRGRPFPIDLDSNGKEILLPKRPQAIRLAFLGDSFTFGEGVHDQDTFAQATAANLQNQWPDRILEAANYGVGGYNTNQSFHVLQRWAIKTDPDAVILGFVLNDAESPIFAPDPASGQPVRRKLAVEQGRFGSKPPDHLIYRSSIARLIWKFRADRQQTESTVEHYRSLYRDANPAWKTNRAALLGIVETCQEHQIPCYVLLFPVLYELNDNYPLKDVHARIRETLDKTHATFIDLLPQLSGMKAADLWVHPSDHHPNEKVHALVGKILAEHLARDLPKIAPARGPVEKKPTP